MKVIILVCSRVCPSLTPDHIEDCRHVELSYCDSSNKGWLRQSNSIELLLQSTLWLLGVSLCSVISCIKLSFVSS